MKPRILLNHAILALMCACSASVWAQDAGTILYKYVMHSSGNVLGKGADDRAVLLDKGDSRAGKLQLTPAGNGYYYISAADGAGYMQLEGSWDTYFRRDNSAANAQYAVETSEGRFVKLRCLANGRYLGTDGAEAGAHVYSDKAGNNTLHSWYLADDKNAGVPVDTMVNVINPDAVRQQFEGWGVSLCWWANMCGKWSDEKIDELVDWLVSPDGLNYRIFRYNIGGGDDPENRNCTPHHMGNGKGLRAEMEGFKDSPDGDYIWTRDEAQRKIMLKIKERRPDAVFEAFSNSCPYYMTYSGCCAGNDNAGEDNLRPEYYEEFARYLVDVCKHYKDEYGIEFRTLDPFNEPLTNYWGRNGGQEGCHFDVESQIAFLKILHPILQESGLATVISASDETDVSRSVSTFEAYKEAGVLDLVGQWNTHTYGVDNKSRTRLRALCADAGMRLWMSETGLGGSGISGNLELAQRLMDDVRYMMPAAWIDWQYVEEGNDQWCTVRGDFAAQTYTKVKNYYVRQQFSRFIKEGYTILTTINDNVLAARNAEGDTLVIVAMNRNASPTVQSIDLSFYESAGSGIEGWRTSESEDMAAFADFELENSRLVFETPGLSVTTLVLPVRMKSAPQYGSLEEGVPYAILPRMASGMSVQAQPGGNARLGQVSLSEDKAWKLEKAGSGWEIVCDGARLTYGDSYSVTAQAADAAGGQVFVFESIDEPYFKIMTEDGTRALDLENEDTDSGTNVGVWEYGTALTGVHRQWLVLRVPEGMDDITDGISDLSGDVGKDYVIGVDGAVKVCGKWTVRLYTTGGIQIACFESKESENFIPMAGGLYLVSLDNGRERHAKVVCVK